MEIAVPKVWSVLKESKRTKQDIYYTPPECLEEISKYIDKGSFRTIWEPACGKYHISKFFEEKGFNVISTDISNTEKKNRKNFLDWSPKEFDLIFTNPPFSIKCEFLQRCYDLDKPFVLLMPLPCIGYIKVSRLLKKYGYLQVFIPPRKIKFISSDDKVDNPYFSSAFFAWKLDNIAENRIIFID